MDDGEITQDKTDENRNKAINIFGRDVTQIPCFRSSFLYGITGGIIIGVLAFLRTSRPTLSTHIGFASFCCGTSCYWLTCRYQWSQRRFQYQQLQSTMRDRNIYEGTEVEKEWLKSA